MPFNSPVMQKMILLADCLCTQIAADELPGLCWCGILPGDTIAIDNVNCKSKQACGFGYVRLASAAMQTGIGVVSEAVNNCSSEIGFVLEVGIMRCAPVASGASGQPPTMAQWFDTTDLQIADMTTMKKAITCCEGLGDRIIDAYEPFGPDGGAVGGFWQVTLGAGDA